MIYKLLITPDAQADLDALKRSGDKAAMKKLDQLFKELRQHPETGTGQPEQLKGNFQGCWSRRINRKDRLLYRIVDEETIVVILFARGHYTDK